MKLCPGNAQGGSFLVREYHLVFFAIDARYKSIPYQVSARTFMQLALFKYRY